MFGLGFGEIVIVAILALVLLGPDRLPEAAKALGKTLHLRMDRFRPGLDDEELAGANVNPIAVLGPLDVLLIVMILDDAGPLGQLKNFIVGQHIIHPFCLGGGDILDRLKGAWLVV